jgi:hypothetical protein
MLAKLVDRAYRPHVQHPDASNRERWVCAISPGVFATLLTCALGGASNHCEAQVPNPTVRVYAYESEIVGGIPSGRPGPGPAAPQTRRLIFLETPPKAQLVVEGVWIDDQYFSTEAVVMDSPVRFESPVVLAHEARNIAVPATTNTVTQILMKQPLVGKRPDEDARKILRDNAAAVQLSISGKALLVPIKRFDRRSPVYLP